MTPEAGERRAAWGTIVRVVVLVLLVAVVVPALIANGDALAVPVVALAALGATAVMVTGLVYWLLTKGIAGQWLARRAHVTPNAVLGGGAIAVAVAAGAGLVWLRTPDDPSDSALRPLAPRPIPPATRPLRQR